ncbi:MAG: hypothetical protein ACYDHU_08035 [Acidimicrobiales bacterium]
MTTITVHPDRSRPTEPGATDISLPLRIVAWEDPVVDAAGMDPRSAYVETYWLPVLGPSATWLLRHLADGLDAAPDGFDLWLEDEARRLGLGGLGSRHSPFQRAILRCTRYAVARHVGPRTLAVRRRISPVPHRQVIRFPDSLRAQHDRWEAGAGVHDILPEVRLRARTLALDLVAAEGSAWAVERRLDRWGVHPALAHESAEWAWARHLEAALVVDGSAHPPGAQPAGAGSVGDVP